MAYRYLKLGPEQSLAMRDKLDFAEQSLANILEPLRDYKLSRRKEIVLKNKLKVGISSLKAKLGATEVTFPEEERKVIQNSMYKEYEKTQRDLQNKRHENIKRHMTNYFPQKQVLKEYDPEEPAPKEEYDDEQVQYPDQSYSDNPDTELDDIRDKLSKFSA